MVSNCNLNQFLFGFLRIGATIRIGREIQCLPYARFSNYFLNFFLLHLTTAISNMNIFGGQM